MSFDIANFVLECFKLPMKSIDAISVTANCKIRRIFSMKSALIESNSKNSNSLALEFPFEYAEILPKNLIIPNTVQTETINLNFEKVRNLKNENESKMAQVVDSTTASLSSPKENKRSESKIVESSSKVKKSENFVRSKSNAAKFKPKKSTEMINQQEFVDFKIKMESRSPRTSINQHKRDIKNIIIGKKFKKDEKLKNVKQENPILLNTLNYKNLEKWETSQIDYIEEHFEHDNEKREIK